MSTVRVTLAPASSSLSLAVCTEPRRGFERIGSGKYGLHFDVPQRDVRLIRGKVDVDYAVHIVKAKRGDDRVEFWLGVYAMSPTPADEQFVESKTFATRNVIMPKVSCKAARAEWLAGTRGDACRMAICDAR